MKYKLFISDFDGTLGVAPDVISEDNVKAIKEYTEKGGKFVICTGRMFSAIKPICDKYGLKGLVVSYQGATIDDLSSGERILEGGIEPSLAVEVINDLLQDGMPVCTDIEDTMFCEQESGYTDYHKNFAKVIKVESLPDLVLQKNKLVMKVVTAGEPDKIRELIEKYNRKYQGRLVVNGGADILIEIVSPEYSKGSSVRYLSRHFGIPLNEIIAVGDSTNDIELIQGEWQGVAVGDAKEQLKKVAKEVTVDFKDNPIKVLLEKYCL